MTESGCFLVLIVVKYNIIRQRRSARIGLYCKMTNSQIARERFHFGKSILLLALTGAVSAAVFFGVRYFAERYLASVTAVLPDAGLGARALLAAMFAGLAASLFGYLLSRKLFGATASPERTAHALVFGEGLGTVVVTLLIAVFAMRGLLAKLIACAAAALLSLLWDRIGYAWENRKKTETPSETADAANQEGEDAPKKKRKKKSFVSRFLFSGQKKPFWIRSPYLTALIRMFSVLIVLLFPFYCHFMLECANYAPHLTKFAAFLHDRMPALILGMTVLYLLYAVLLLLCKKAWIAVLLMYLISGGMAITNYLKIALAGQNFFPWDLIEQGGNVGELLSFVQVGIPLWMILLLVFGALCVAVLVISRISLPVCWPLRLVGAAAIILLTYFSVSTPQKITLALDKYGMSLFDMALQESNYEANGFTCGFTVNILSLNIAEPEGYSEEAMKEMRDNYHASAAAEDFSSPDVILVLAESFWDPRNLPGTTFSQNPFENFDEITARPGTISGRLYMSPNGGGTIYTEYEMLTGLSSACVPSGSVPWQYVSQESPSFASLFSDLGYDTLAFHPYLSSFYSRKQTYPLIGFDNTYFIDVIENTPESERPVPTLYRGRQVSDDTFVDYLEYYLDNASSGNPQFLFGISMENHQPYENKFAEEEKYVEVTNPNFSEAAMNPVLNFTQGAADADAALGKLVDYIDNRDRDTVLIWFGDHLPTLGPNLLAYKESGFINDYTTSEERIRIHNTPFVIYANFPLSEGELLKFGTENDVPAYGLMTAACETFGAPQTMVGDFVVDYVKTIPFYYSVDLLTPTAEQQKMIDLHRILTYDILAGKRYSLAPEQ